MSEFEPTLQDVEPLETWFRGAIGADPVPDLEALRQIVRCAIAEQWFRAAQPADSLPPHATERLRARVHDEVARVHGTDLAPVLTHPMAARKRVYWWAGATAAAAVLGGWIALGPAPTGSVESFAVADDFASFEYDEISQELESLGDEVESVEVAWGDGSWVRHRSGVYTEMLDAIEAVQVEEHSGGLGGSWNGT